MRAPITTTRSSSATARSSRAAGTAPWWSTENAVEISRGRLVAAFQAAGLTCTFLVSFEDAQAANTLVEIEGFVPLDDPRLVALRQRLGDDLYRLVAMGVYAAPLDIGAPRPAAAPLEERRTAARG